MAMIRLRIGDVLEISFPGATPKIELRMQRVTGDTVLYDVSAPPYCRIEKWEDRWEPQDTPSAIKLSPPPKALTTEEGGDTAA